MKYVFTPADGSPPVEFETDAELPAGQGELAQPVERPIAEAPGGPGGTPPR